MPRTKRLSDSIAEELLSKIIDEKRFLPGDKLPNENELSKELDISRTTLREAVRVLVAGKVLEVRRGSGTFVSADLSHAGENKMTALEGLKTDIRDLFEMRLICEPEAAYLAAQRATDSELKRIAALGRQIEEQIKDNTDRTETEQKFHKAIAKASHNEFMNKLMPIIYEGIYQGVVLTEQQEEALEYTIRDHQMLLEFIQKRNAEGARNAMRIHILHAMEALDVVYK